MTGKNLPEDTESKARFNRKGINGFLPGISNTEKWTGAGWRGCSDDPPPLLPNPLFSMADSHMQPTRNRKITNKGIYNLAMSSDTHMHEENVFPYNPGICKTNWHFNPPAEATDTRGINSTHLRLPNVKPKPFQNAKWKYCPAQIRVCSNKSTFYSMVVYSILGTPPPTLNDIQVSGTANRTELGNQCIL